MISCKSMKEVFSNAPAIIFMDIFQVIANDSENVDTETFLAWCEDLYLSYGGNVNIVEEYSDLADISTLYDSEDIAPIEQENLCKEPIEESDSHRLNITQCYSTFDVAYYLPGKEWAILCMCTNNAGGEIYYIPKHIYEHCPNIAKAIEISELGNEYTDLSEFNESNTKLLNLFLSTVILKDIK